MNHNIKALKAAFPHTVPVLAGFSFLGIAYGVLMATKGYGLLWIFLMSAVAFCGSMQFLAITLITTAFNPIGALMMALMVNARHLFYGISMLEKYKGLGKIKYFLIYTLCDETFSTCYSAKVPEEVNRGLFYFWISFLNYIYWISASLLGALMGSLISFDTKGLDFALTALFVVIFIDGWKEQGNRIPGLIGMGCSFTALFIWGADHFIIPSMVCILAVLTLSRRTLEEGDKEGEVSINEIEGSKAERVQKQLEKETKTCI